MSGKENFVIGTSRTYQENVNIAKKKNVSISQHKKSNVACDWVQLQHGSEG